MSDHLSTTTAPIGLSSYAALPRAAGWSFLISTSLGRLPMSMVPLAVLTLASTATGSIAVGGLAAAAAAIGEAIGAPVSGALADRFGQRTVLLIGVVLHVVALGGFTAAIGVVPDQTAIGLAGLAGLTLPQVGALSRARWLAIAPEHSTVAFAFEGVLDEIVYIFGPALVGIISVVADAHVAVLFAGLLIAVFATWFAVHPSHRRVPRRGSLPAPVASRPAEAPAPRDRSRRRILIALAFTGTLAMGCFFGGAQTGLTAFAAQSGIPDAGALLYSAMAVGSAITTMSMVLVPARVSLWLRWALAATGMTLGAVLLLTSTSVPMVIATAALAGAFQGPLLLTVFSVAGSVTEEGEGGFIMTLTASGVVVGIALSSAIAGPLSEAFGAAGGFGVVLAASLLLFALGVTALASSRFAAARRAPIVEG